ncbi:MAG: RhuM family protein [Bryobacteraceae bacterium]
MSDSPTPSNTGELVLFNRSVALARCIWRRCTTRRNWSRNQLVRNSYKFASRGVRQVQRPLRHDGLAAVLAVGDRVRFARGAQFRQWAAARLHDWTAKLDEFLRISDREGLTHTGTVSHAAAVSTALKEIDRYRAVEERKPQAVDAHFQEANEKTKKLDGLKGKARSIPRRDRT